MDHQQKLVDEFNKAHENIEVTLEAYGSNYDTKISAGMGSSDAPDIMYMWNYPAYADGLEPLESCLLYTSTMPISNVAGALRPYFPTGN